MGKSGDLALPLLDETILSKYQARIAKKAVSA